MTTTTTSPHWLWKPRLGMRRISGEAPPSKIGLSGPASQLRLVPCGRGRWSCRGPTRAAADALRFLVLLDADVDVVQVHDSVTPRSRSTSCRVRSCCSAASVALTRFVGLFEPKLLVRMLWMPAASQPRARRCRRSRRCPGRRAPAPRGRRRTAHRRGAEWCRRRARFRSCCASLPSRPSRRWAALRWPCRSPSRPCRGRCRSTTMAAKLKRRPPLTTAAQRLIFTTFSISSPRLRFVGHGARAPHALQASGL